MLDQKERLFIKYWEARREKERSIGYRLLSGFPVGLLFALPVFLLLFSGRFWYKRADMVANSQLSPGLLVGAGLMIAGFVAVIYKSRQWDRNEQQFLSLKAREKNDLEPPLSQDPDATI